MKSYKNKDLYLTFDSEIKNQVGLPVWNISGFFGVDFVSWLCGCLIKNVSCSQVSF